MSTKTIKICLLLALGWCASVTANAANAGINGYAVADKGYYGELHPCSAGLIATSERGNDIMLVRADGTVQPMLTAPGAGRYVNVSADGRTLGFKSINDRHQQAPALMDIATGAVKMLDAYSDTQCGQVSFANDGTMVWTRGNKLVVARPGQARKELTMPFYTNIVNINPQGTAVAFGHKTGDFYTMDLATGQAVKHGINAGAYLPVWSPDGSKIAVRCADGKVFAVATADYERRYDLGEAKSLSWMPDSRQIVMTQSWRPNSELRCEGASVKVVNFDGTAERNIVTNDASVPSAVVADADGALLISYATGQKRGITRMAVKTDAAGRISAPAREVTLVNLDGDQQIGTVMGQKAEMAAYTKLATDSVKPGMHRTGSLGLTAVPYHNQVWDTPVNYWGDTSWGYSACAPSSCCMNMGYWGHLSAWPSSSRYDGRTVNYANYIGLDYTSPITGYTFNDRADGSGGGYGYMWDGWSPRTSMVSFYQNNGFSAGQDASWSSFNTECSYNYNYTLCVELGVSAGHVILGFRTDEAESGGGIYYCDGAFICNDPYGDKNYAYPSYAGYYASYDWPGYNNGHVNIGTFYWGVWARSNYYGSPQGGGSTATPSITAYVYPEDPNGCAKVDGGWLYLYTHLNEDFSTTLWVESANCDDNWIYVTSNNDHFTITNGSGNNWVPASGGYIGVTFTQPDKAGTWGRGGDAWDMPFALDIKCGSTTQQLLIWGTVYERPSIVPNVSQVELEAELNGKASTVIWVGGTLLDNDITFESNNAHFVVTNGNGGNTIPRSGGYVGITFEQPDVVGTWGNGGTAWNMPFGITFTSGSVSTFLPIFATVTVKPKITASVSAINFETNVNQQPQGVHIDVTTENMPTDQYIQCKLSDTEHFSLYPINLLPSTCGAIQVDFIKPDVVGTYGPGGSALDKDLCLVLESQYGSVTIPIRCSVTDPEGTYYATALGDFTEEWNYSLNKGNLADATWFANDPNTAMARSIAVLGQRLFVASDKTFGAQPTIAILNADTGVKIGELSTAGIEGAAAETGYMKISSLRTFNGDLYASSGSRATDHLRVYKWTNGTGDPEIVLDDATHAGIAAGDHMGFWSTANGAGPVFTNGTKVIWYYLADGVNATAYTFDLAAPVDISGSAGQITYDGYDFWLVTKGTVPTLYNGDGTVKGAMPATVLDHVNGTAATFFNYGNEKYAALVNTLGGSTANTWGNACARIVNITDGPESAFAIDNGTYPAAGLGDANWGATERVTDICHRLSDTNDSQCDLWVLAPRQGIARYKFVGKSSAVSDIAVDNAGNDADAPVEFYNLQGVRMNADNLQPGIYIRRQGRNTTKMLVK